MINSNGDVMGYPWQDQTWDRRMNHQRWVVKRWIVILVHHESWYNIRRLQSIPLNRYSSRMFPWHWIAWPMTSWSSAAPQARRPWPPWAPWSLEGAEWTSPVDMLDGWWLICWTIFRIWNHPWLLMTRKRRKGLVFSALGTPERWFGRTPKWG